MTPLALPITQPVTQTAVSLFGATLGVPPATTAVAFPSPASTPSTSFLGEMQAAIPGASAASAATPAPFADLLTEAVGQVQELERKAKTSIEGLISGRGVDVHEAMIASQKAGMGFELVLSVRNKALAAYQQVMGMQF